MKLKEKMNKKIVAIILEIIPIVSTIMSVMLIVLDYNSKLIERIVSITTLLAFFGFVFFFIGRKLLKEDRMVQVLGILDLLATIYVLGLYTIAIFVFGL